MCGICSPNINLVVKRLIESYRNGESQACTMARKITLTKQGSFDLVGIPLQGNSLTFPIGAWKYFPVNLYTLYKSQMTPLEFCSHVRREAFLTTFNSPNSFTLIQSDLFMIQLSVLHILCLFGYTCWPNQRNKTDKNMVSKNDSTFPPNLESFESIRTNFLLPSLFTSPLNPFLAVKPSLGWLNLVLITYLNLWNRLVCILYWWWSWPFGVSFSWLCKRPVRAVNVPFHWISV